MSTIHHKKVGSAIASALLATTSAAVATLATAPLAAPATAVAATPDSAHPSASAVDPIESMPLWRVQVQLTTGIVREAATRGHPAIRFNATTTGVRTLNPQSPTAFAQGHPMTYDVRLFGDPSQITMLRLGIAGADNWCDQKANLLLNERVAFSWALKGGTCAMIEQGARNLDFSSGDLRSNPLWTSFGQPPALPTRISVNDLRARIADVTGSAILSMPRVSWDVSRPVTVVRTSNATVKVSYGLIDMNGFPRKVLVSFEVRFFVNFLDGKLHAEMRNPVPATYASRASGPAVTDLNTALTRMTTVPLPHPPLIFGVDAFANLSWRFGPVVAG